MQNKIHNEAVPVFFINPRQAILQEVQNQAPAYRDAFLSAEDAPCSEYCLNTTTWD